MTVLPQSDRELLSQNYVLGRETPVKSEDSVATEEPPSAPLGPIGEDNIGYRMMKSMNWKDGEGLGREGSGRTDNIEVISSHKVVNLLPIQTPFNTFPMLRFSNDQRGPVLESKSLLLRSSPRR